MDFSKYKKLAINTGLAFLAGAITSFGVLVVATPKDDLKAFVLAVLGGAVYAGARAAYGYLSLNAATVPAVPTDVP